MKDEIKEILDDMKIVAEHKTVGVMGQQLNFKNTRILLDYITNLQEENERLNKNNQAIWQIAEDYKSRNEKAIEYIKTRKEEYNNSNELSREYINAWHYCKLINDILELLEEVE